MFKNLKFGILFFSFLIIAAGAAVRFSSIQFPYIHADEIITVKVSEMIIAENSLDTNWEKADLPFFFKYPQYNFSSYNIFSAGTLKLAQTFLSTNDFTSFGLLRYMSAALGTLIIILTIFLGRQLFNIETGLLAAFIVAANPLLYQDSLYARPETFVTALTLFYLLILGTSKISLGYKLLASSFILGVLVATKISMLVLMPLLLLPTSNNLINGRLSSTFALYVESAFKLIPTAIKVVPFGFFIGFFCLAPYAVINFDKFLFGFQKLNEQYTTGHWPHGLLDGEWFERLNYAGNYFFPTTGLIVFLMALAGAYLSLKEQKFRQLIIFAVFAVFAIRFGTYPTFFERNFSHLLPLIFIFSAYALTKIIHTLQLSPTIRTTILITTTILVLITSLNTLYILRFNELPGKLSGEVSDIRNKLEKELGITTTKTDWIIDYSAIESKYTQLCEPILLEFRYPNDKYSIIALNKIKDLGGYIEVGRFTSPFANVSPSTLHTYFTPTTIFLFKDTDPKNCSDSDIKFVSGKFAGDVIKSNLVYTDTTWTIGGSFDGLADLFHSKDYYGSWSGSDSGTGKMRLTVSLVDKKYFALPFSTGPISDNQFIKVIDADSNNMIFSSGPLKTTSEKWKVMLITIPEGVNSIIIEAIDEGSGWGEWHAIGMPRASKE